MEFNPMNLAVLLLAAIVGISFANILFNWLTRFLISLAVVVFVFIALMKGQSDLAENLTYNLGRYFANEPFGLMGFVLGILVGTALRRRRR